MSGSSPVAARRPPGLLPVALALAAASLLYCLPLFGHLDRWGRQDWDQFTFRYETPRLALLRDHVLPTWNPYAGGGTALLAHPNSPALSPLYLPVLVIGAPLGLRVQVVIFMAVGAIGMAALVRRLGSRVPGSLVGGVVYTMSSHFVLHSTEGHMEWSVLGLMPWLALSVLRAQERWRYGLVAALLLGAVLGFGAVYVPAVFAPFFSAWFLLLALQQRRASFAVAWFAPALLSLLLAGAKLVPMAHFTAGAPREVKLDQHTYPSVLAHGLFDPRQALLYRAWRDRDLPEGHFARTLASDQAARAVTLLERLRVDEGFHEYGCYVGLAGWVLVALGLARTLRQLWPLYVTGCLALVMVCGSSSPLDLWALLRQLPFYGQLQVPARFLAAVVFVLAVAAAMGMDALCGPSARRPRRIVAWVLAVALYGELCGVGWSLFGDVFVVPPVAHPPHADFAQRFRDRFEPGSEERDHGLLTQSVMVGHLLSNSGTLDAYENMSLQPGDVLTTADPGYRGEVYLLHGRGKVQVVEWTMSRVRARVEVTEPDELVMNQNFDGGWRARRTGAQGSPDILGAARSARGLISVPVLPEHREVELWYRPAGLTAGLAVSLAALSATLALALSGRGSSRWLRTPRGSPRAPSR